MLPKPPKNTELKWNSQTWNKTAICWRHDLRHRKIWCQNKSQEGQSPSPLVFWVAGHISKSHKISPSLYLWIKKMLKPFSHLQMRRLTWKRKQESAKCCITNIRFFLIRMSRGWQDRISFPWICLKYSVNMLKNSNYKEEMFLTRSLSRCFQLHCIHNKFDYYFNVTLNHILLYPWIVWYNA